MKKVFEICEEFESEQENGFPSDLVKAKYGFVSGNFEKDGKLYYGWLSAGRKPNGNIWFHYEVEEVEKKINLLDILEPVLDTSNMDFRYGRDQEHIITCAEAQQALQEY